MFTFLNHGAKLTRIPSSIIAITTLAVLAAVIATLALGSFTAQAQEPAGSINNQLVSSPDPGQLVITWDSPTQTPTDYRVRWAPCEPGLPLLLSRKHLRTRQRVPRSHHPDGGQPAHWHRVQGAGTSTLLRRSAPRQSLEWPLERRGHHHGVQRNNAHTGTYRGTHARACLRRGERLGHVESRRRRVGPNVAPAVRPAETTTASLGRQPMRITSPTRKRTLPDEETPTPTGAPRRSP